MLWDDSKLVEGGYLRTRLQLKDPATGSIEKIQAPVGAPGMSIWNGVVSTIRLVNRHFLFSQRSVEGVWTDNPTSLDGDNDLRGVPFMLYGTESPARFFAMNIELGFVKGQEASPCSWWRQRSDGTLEPESLISMELDLPIYLPLRGMMGNTFSTQLTAHYAGLAPFLEYPIRVKGAFLVVSWHAGILWVIKDGYPYPTRTLRLLSLDEDRIAGKIKHPHVLLGIQPMVNGHVLIAMRTEQAILNPPEKPSNSEKEKLTQPKVGDAQAVAPPSAHLEILWKDFDPLEGTLSEADGNLLGDAPRVLASEQEALTFSFGFDPKGRLNTRNTKSLDGPQSAPKSRVVEAAPPANPLDPPKTAPPIS